MILPGVIAKGLALIDGLLDFWVDEVGTTTIAGACGNLTVRVVGLNACGEEFLRISQLYDIPLAAWQDWIFPIFLTWISHAAEVPQP